MKFDKVSSNPSVRIVPVSYSYLLFVGQDFHIGAETHPSVS